ncbi:MAG: UDP-N-acetylglucosamine 2-epimerase (non-hydrolyzing) [Thermoanaerobaculia bacterium]|jgi:UDP-N-acetylglucosamine 2-epimerase (non-hydrolysing)
MKIMTVLGTRPEIIRLSILIERLDLAVDHVLVHTDQNSDPMLSRQFFEELGVRAPDHHLGLAPASLGHRIGQVLAGVDDLLRTESPDRLVLLGDTDSALCALVAKRSGIPVVHLEAGNRCFDDRVPEEVNRRVIDHCSDLLLPYTARSREHLIAEGIPSSRIVVLGNPINEVMLRHAGRRNASDVLERLGLERGGYAIVTAHRQENVDDPERLRSIGRALAVVSEQLRIPVVVSVHPRTRDRLSREGVSWDTAAVRTCPPLGFSDFVALEEHARLALTDSGTVQEECCILGVPAVTIRDTTERPETVECGSNIVCGVEPDDVLEASLRQVGRSGWTVPPEYLATDVSAKAAALATGPLEF